MSKFDRDDPDTAHPVLIAKALGYRSNGYAGRQILTALEVAFILRAARQAKFTGRVNMRLRQNVFIEGPAGIGKSFVGDFFYGQCCGAISQFAREGVFTVNRPRLIQQSGAMTFEKMRGSCTTDGRPIMPALLNADFVNMTEMSSVFGEPRVDMKLVRQFGGLAEEGKLEVSLLKMDEMDAEAAEEYAKATQHIPNYHFNVEPRGYWFSTDASFSIATTDLEPTVFKAFRKSGFLSRFDYIKVSMSASEQLDFLARFGSGPTIDSTKLRAVNDDIWATRMCAIPYPPAELLDNFVQKWLVDQVAEAAKQHDQQPLAIANLRDIGNAARLMAASAISRIFEHRTIGDRTPIESIEYTIEDAEFAVWYLTPHFNALRVIAPPDDAEEKIAWDKVPEEAHGILTDMLEEQFIENEGKHLPSRINIKSFIDRVRAKNKAEKTARNYITVFVKAGIFLRSRAVKDTVAVDMKYLTDYVGLRADVDRDDEEAIEAR